jgi:hypothetical protein
MCLGGYLALVWVLRRNSLLCVSLVAMGYGLGYEAGLVWFGLVVWQNSPYVGILVTLNLELSNSRLAPNTRGLCNDRDIRKCKFPPLWPPRAPVAYVTTATSESVSFLPLVAPRPPAVILDDHPALRLYSGTFVGNLWRLPAYSNQNTSGILRLWAPVLD